MIILIRNVPFSKPLRPKPLGTQVYVPRKRNVAYHLRLELFLHTQRSALHISKKIIFCTLKDSKKNVFDSFPELLELVQTELKNRLQQVAGRRVQHAALGGREGCTNACDTSRACVHRCNLLLSPRTTASRTPGRFEIVKSAEHSSSSFFLPLLFTYEG